MKIIAKNRKVFLDYEVIERVEAGMRLQGSEVKGLRTGECSIAEAFVRVIGGEAYVIGMSIPPYKAGGYANHESNRRRKLLLHRREIAKLAERINQKGYTVVPLKLYFNDRGFAKVELGVAHGKKKYDRREALKERETARDIARASRRGRR
jgi:SsrA-binding protein